MMNGPRSASVSGGDSALVSWYEGLRRQALGSRDGEGRGLGWALLVRQGMKSWMQAWSECVTQRPAISTTKTGREDVSLIQSSREVVVVLACMALGGYRQEARQ
jgi:hypothetical protein